MTPESSGTRLPARSAKREGTAQAKRNGDSSAQALPLLLSACVGGLNTLSFAPVPHGGWFELPVMALAFWLVTQTRSAAGAALTAAAFGFGGFVSGIWWLYISMHFYGGMPAPLALPALMLFCGYLSIYPALASASWHALGRARGAWLSSAVFASSWTLGEWLRGLVFTGFPWLASGYPQVDGPLAGFASLVGVYGVGWLVALIGALLTYACRALPGGDARAGCLHAALVSALLVAGLGLSRVRWTHPLGRPLHVRLLQGDVPQNMKFDRSGVNHALALYRKFITARPADLVVTPETALPMLLQQIPDQFGRPVRAFVDQTGSAVLFGAVGATVTEHGASDYTNSVFGLTPGQGALYHYDKHHLVPFGEFVPWGFRWFINLMHIPLGDFARGAPVQAPFVVRGQALAPSICYEDIFGEEIARTLRGQQAPPGILVNSTNLAWFGDTVALDQHLQIARMRALETGRPMLRATNTGVTAAIDPDGRVLDRLPAYAVGALDVEVQARAGYTPYIQLGNGTVLTVSGVLLAFAFLGRRARRPSAA